MSGIKRIEFDHHIGCHHDKHNNLVGGYVIQKVALFNSDKISPEEACKAINNNMYNAYVMTVDRLQYEHILTPAVLEERINAVKTHQLCTGCQVLYFDNDGSCTIRCEVESVSRDKTGDVNLIALKMLDDNNNNIKTIQEDNKNNIKKLWNHLFFSHDDIDLNRSFQFWGI